MKYNIVHSSHIRKASWYEHRVTSYGRPSSTKLARKASPKWLLQQEQKFSLTVGVYHGLSLHW